MSTRRHQSGFTLVEILIALLVGLFLAAGLITMTQHNKTTYNNQTLISQLQDNERFALSVINDVIQAAGYFPDPLANTAMSDMPVAAPFTQQGQPLFGTARTAGTPATITAQYALANKDTVETCAGQVNGGAQAVYANQFSVVPNVANPTQGQLICTVTTGGKQTKVQLVSGVTDLQIRYGVTSPASALTHDVTVYKTADQMAAADWMNVTLVQVTLTFANPLAGQPGVPANATIPIVRNIGLMMRAAVTT
jgi:type IV pilus assembly protein PilW